MRDITFRASPAWTIHPLLCNDVLAERITIESGQFDGDKEYTGHNVDGFDPDSCTNVVLRDSHIHAGDDCVAMLGGTDARVSCPRTKQILRGGGTNTTVLPPRCLNTAGLTPPACAPPGCHIQYSRPHLQRDG